MEEEEKKAAMDFINTHYPESPYEIEYRARIHVLEVLVARILATLPKEQTDDFRAFPENSAKRTDELNGALVGQSGTIHEEFTHQTNVACRGMLEKISDLEQVPR